MKVEKSKVAPCRKVAEFKFLGEIIFKGINQQQKNMIGGCALFVCQFVGVYVDKKGYSRCGLKPRDSGEDYKIIILADTTEAVEDIRDYVLDSIREIAKWDFQLEIP